jgi:GTP-binding nuclear protein Ran
MAVGFSRLSSFLLFLFLVIFSLFFTAKMNYKLVLVGDSGVGKSAFVRRHLAGEFEKKHIKTLGVEVHPLTFSTTRGVICFSTWDTAGDEKLGGRCDGYYVNADAVIVFGDLTSPSSFLSMKMWARDVQRISPRAKIIFVGNKVDSEGGVKSHEKVPWEMKRALLPYYDISAKSNYQFEKPFLYLARELTGDSSLEFVPGPAFVPPIVEVPQFSHL